MYGVIDNLIKLLFHYCYCFVVFFFQHVGGQSERSSCARNRTAERIVLSLNELDRWASQIYEEC